ncbi:MAG: Ribulose-phosphate 3-epimerase [Berkelbacteria bacterium GW2011_GWA2_35_9]|uniref:Ribulose-phosphate 3-epimerase n=1 Tax=Berkelbacteria bacterium GW2011_GWA2_35_9 TaxID=1618333 RepID=A0A0G0D088_9BACT|nr:MAG: Ribulose-phosphate 3-epimerase [Berkelbacteria bacterium GW2011_GWA2_35_9]
MNNRKYKLSASLICGDIINLKEDLKSLEKGKADYLHFDMMDGLFVPRFGQYPEILKSIKENSKIPVDVHLMIQNPEPYIEVLADAGADVIVPHIESTPHIHRVVKKIKDLGVRAGVALNPGTSLSTLDYLIDEIDWVELMAINPGIVGHKLIPNMLNKIYDLKKIVGLRENFEIQIDGGVTPGSASKMVTAGATVLVCGSSTIYRPKEGSLDVRLNEMRKIIDTETAL